jgi:hypothetical protein
MIIWSGWGFLVNIFFLIGALIGLPVGAMVSPDPVSRPPSPSWSAV